ncbi:MAG: branched-chain amino acid ABC transporter permease [Xanthobacteraceae bacterium]
MTLQTFLFVCLSGVVLGALFALMATGLAVVWTTLGIFNFAHGTFIAAGAYLAWQLSQGGHSAGFLPSAAISIASLFAVGVLFHLLLVKPFERKPNAVLLSVMTTLAGASILEGIINLVWGPRSKQLQSIVGDIRFAGIVMSYNDLVMIAVAVAILAAVGAFLRYSTIGRSMRAVAQNREAAQLLGLNVPLLYALAFGLSAALAGMAGLFVGSMRFMTPSMGSEPLMKALIVVIFGGIARFTSPIYAAFVVGMLEAFSTYYVGLYWTPAVLFALMIAVLMIKPEGLFGKYERSV